MYGTNWAQSAPRTGTSSTAFPSAATATNATYSQSQTPNYYYNAPQASYGYNSVPGYFNSYNTGNKPVQNSFNLSEAAQNYAKLRQAEPLPPGCLPTPVTTQRVVTATAASAFASSQLSGSTSTAGAAVTMTTSTTAWRPMVIPAVASASFSYYQPRQQQQQPWQQPWRQQRPMQQQQQRSKPPLPPPPTLPQSKPPPPPPPPPPASSVSKPLASSEKSVMAGMDQWPQSLKNYVARAFSACETEQEKDDTEVKLRHMLLGGESILSRDWDKVPLPLASRKRKSRWATPPPSGDAKRSGSGSTPFSTSTSFVNAKSFVPQQQLGAAAFKGFPQRGRGQISRGRGRGRGARKEVAQQQQRSSRAWSSDSSSRSSSRSRSSSPRRSRRSRRRRRVSRSRSRSYSSRSRSYSSRSRSRSFSSSRTPSPAPRKISATKGGKKKQQSTKIGKKAKIKKKFVMVKDEKQLSKRAQRFGNQLNDAPKTKKANFTDLINQGNNKSNGENDIDWSRFAIRGTCQKLEKQYLRLTSAPDPSLVRPLPVLKKALDMVSGKWKAKEKSYRWTCEQMKSIRQDLTVQCTRNEFTVKVYESHARIALEQGDREEFNQCLTQLRALYKETVVGHVVEFTAYWILYLLLTKNTADMNLALSSLSSEMQAEPPVKHALRLRSAWALSNYHKFFRLYRVAPNMGASLIDMFVQRVRLSALRVFTKACRPTLPLSFLQSELGFDSIDDCRSFLQQNGGIRHGQNDDVLDCKLTYSNLIAISQS
ncbi:leukocyte receptor cluster member 8-like [Oscarella lobularis]|uniref:leukocyte receptor cluster member 8-like n=1 Tax=Oscarella lobularis TaxID=121494 RepID=UPI0033137999